MLLTLGYSYPLENEALEKSIRAFGLIYPLQFVRRKEETILISGYRRLYAWQKVNPHGEPPITFLEEKHDLKHLFLAGLSENATHRKFNVIEKAKAFDIARTILRFSDEEIFAGLCPLLGLQPSGKVI